MAQKKTRVPVEIGTEASARGAYNAWVAAKAALDAAETAKAQAEAVLKPYFDKGDQLTIGGVPVINLVEFDRITFDAAILRKLAPAAARKAERPSHIVQLRKA